MKIVRIALTVIVVAGAGYLAFRGAKGSAPPAPVTPAAPEPAVPGDGGFPTLLGAPLPKPTTSAVPAAQIPVALDEERPSGTPVESGAEVSVAVPYRTGTRTTYRIYDDQGAQDRDSGNYSWNRMIWTVDAEVTSGEGDGAARIRLAPRAFRFQTEAMGRGVEFDSEKPDDKVLSDEALGLGRMLRPLKATLGMPIELTLAASGRVTNVEGAEAIQAKYLATLEDLKPEWAADAPWAPTEDQMLERWTEFLFPTVGAGAMKAADTRPGEFRTTYMERWAARSRGSFRVTHTTPDTFRIEFKGKPELEDRQVQPRSASARSIEKMHVASSADSYVASWTFDRAKGRLTHAFVHAKYQLWVARPTGTDPEGVQQYDRSFSDMERRVRVEIVPQ